MCVSNLDRSILRGTGFPEKARTDLTRPMTPTRIDDACASPMRPPPFRGRNAMHSSRLLLRRFLAQTAREVAAHERAVGAALDLHPAIVQLDEAVDEGEAETGAGALA